MVSIDELCLLFEQDWENSHDSVETFIDRRGLKQLGTENESKLLVRLIQCEIELLRRSQRTPDRSSYLTRFPSLDEEVLDNLLLMPAPPIKRHPKQGGDKPLLPARYRVIEEIGRGGIGSVWRVEDQWMQRTLAAKTLLNKFKFNPSANIRLEREALLAGALQHPGIPPVFETGDLLSGSKFFTMKLVDGETLDALLRKRDHPLANQNYLLGVFRQVAEAAGYAHSQGVIHRDLKPHNVMVGEFGEVQIMDWGMAKRLNRDGDANADAADRETPAIRDDSEKAAIAKPVEMERIGEPKTNSSKPESAVGVDTANMNCDSSLVVGDNGVPPELTVVGEVVGTPMYMSPEQASGNIDQLTTRSDVFSLGAILFEILTGQRLYQNVGQDLIQAASAGVSETELERLNRDAIDTELAAICKSCLAVTPAMRPENGHVVAVKISAHLDSVAERLRAAELEKNSTQVRLLEERKRRKLAFWLSVATVGSVVAGLLGVLWQWDRATKNAAAAMASAKISQASAERSQGVLKVVTDAFESVDPNEGSDSKMTAKQVLLNAESSLNESELDEEGRMILSANLGSCFRALGEFELAAKMYEQALPLQSAILGPRDQETLVTMNHLAVAYLDLGRMKDSLELQTEVLNLQREELGWDAGDTLQSMNNLGIVHEKMGNYDKAVASYQELLAVQDASGKEPHPDTPTWMGNLAAAYSQLGREEEAVKMNEAMLKFQRAELGSDHPLSILLMNNLALSYKSLSRHEEALTLAQEALRRIKVKLGERHPHTSIVMGNVALIHEHMGNFEAAVLLNEKTYALKQEKFGVDHPETLITMNNYAVTLKEVGRFDDALKLQRKMLAMQRERLGPKNPMTLLAMQNLADIYSEKGDLEEALELTQETLELRKEVLGEEHPKTLTSMHNVAELYQAFDRFEESKSLLEETLERKRAQFGEKHTETATTMNSLAQAYCKLGRLDEALALHRQTNELLNDMVGPDHPRTLASSTNLAIVLRKQKKFQEAETRFKETLMAQTKKLGKDHPDALTTNFELAVGYREMGRWDEAIARLEEVVSQLEAKLGKEHPESEKAQMTLVECRQAKAKAEEKAEEKAEAKSGAESEKEAGVELEDVCETRKQRSNG